MVFTFAAVVAGVEASDGGINWEQITDALGFGRRSWRDRLSI